ncbi:hypothetical protein [Vibrio variabilis]|uniref:hypothetical protein n=1 Tax=Vibrio variabilis TaxID=990271 RepID=UPI0013A6C049|nr:hypothetical protein [Vibrio variabilis]
MLDKLYTSADQDDVARNWLIDTPDALNDAGDHGYRRSVTFEYSKVWHAQDGLLLTDRH